MSAFEKVAGMFPSRELGEQVAREVLAEHARELAGQQLAFADQEDGLLNTLCAAAYVRGIRDGARRISPAGETEAPPEVVVRYDSDDALTIRLRDFEVDTIGPGALGIEGRLTSGTGWPRPGNAVRLAELGIPGRGLLADVTASIRLESVDDATIVCIRVALNPKEPTP